jgi:outer membrane immunogenic protein
MNKHLLGAAILLAGVGSAAAADLPVKAPPPPLPVWSWTGFYFGVNAGYAWTNNTALDTITVPGGIIFPLSATTSSAANGFIGGGQVGYNWQTGPFVLGIEGDFDGTAERGNGADSCGTLVVGTCGLTASANVNWLATLRGRAGYAVNNILFYVTGGGAWERVSGSISAVTPTGTFGLFSASTTRSGWAAGAGIETSFWGNWIAGLEYLYVNTGSWTWNNTTFVVAAGSPLAGAGVPVGSIINTGFNTTNNVFRGRVSYKF